MKPPSTVRGALAALLICICALGAGAVRAVPESFPSVLSNILASEGGNSDDPRDSGGRTSRGIIQREWTAWRTSHPGLPSDVFDAPDEEIAAIYKLRYWTHRCVRGDALPAGLDYSVSDFGVNAGVDRAGKTLRRLLLGSDGDTCNITDGLLALIAKKDQAKIIALYSNERRGFYRRLIAARPKNKAFEHGWMARANSVELKSRKMAGVPAFGLFGEEMDPEPAFGPGKAYVEDSR